MKYYKFWVRLVVCTIICSCLLYYFMQLAGAKRFYQQQVNTALDKFLAQQKDFLQKLGQQIVPVILQQDYASISQILHSYEDQIYVLAKHGFTVPMSIQFVSLNAPQKIVTASGVLENLVLAPDEGYYMRAAAAPKQLEWSNVYTHDAMPQHRLINIGYGVHMGDKYLGHLDTQLALNALETFLKADTHTYAKMFRLQFANNRLQSPQIVLQPAAYWSGMLQPVLQTIGMVLIVLCFSLIIYQLYRHAKLVAAALAHTQQQVSELSATVSTYKTILATQYKYGTLMLLSDVKAQLLDVRQLLHDIRAVNADIIQQRAIKLIWPEHIQQNFYIFGHSVRLMQILSGILYEILMQLPDASTVELQVTVQNLTRKKQKIVFSFTDNGFHTSLQECEHENSSTDVRIKGWHNLKRMIKKEKAYLEHTHTAYVGNTISLSVVQELGENVVNLAF